MNPYSITDTYELLGVVERIKPPATYLADTFFPELMPVSVTDFVSIEYRKEGRLLAPYVVQGSRGINISRGGSKVQNYKAPMVAPRRVIGLNDITTRQFGEQPVFSTTTPQERAAQMQANDLVELLRTIQNTKNKMAADILQRGRTTINGYADDGRTVTQDEIVFDWNGSITPQTAWDQSGAHVFEDIKAASERVQEDSGLIPTLMLCGKNIEKYLMSNDEIVKWLSIPNRENLQLMSFSPHYTTPQARFIGYINALNLEVISYSETYIDTDGQVKPYLDPDVCIIGVPGRGKQLHAAVTFMNQQGQWQTVSAANVPVYLADPNAQQSSLTIFSRFCMVPETTDDWLTIKVRG